MNQTKNLQFCIISLVFLLFLSLISLSSEASLLSLYDFQAVAERAQINVNSCEMTNSRITVTNTASEAASYDVEITGGAAKYSSIFPANFVLNEGEKRDIFIAFRAPCRTSATFTLDTYISSNSVKKLISQKIIVSEIPNIVFWTDSNYQTADICEKAVYGFNLKNSGTSDEKYTFVFDSEIADYAAISENLITLAPGAEKGLNFSIQLPCDMKGNFSGTLMVDTEISGYEASLPVYLNIEETNVTSAAKELDKKYRANIANPSIKSNYKTGKTQQLVIQNSGTANATYTVNLDTSYDFISLDQDTVTVTIPSGQNKGINITITPYEPGKYPVKLVIKTGDYTTKKTIDISITRFTLKDFCIKYKIYLIILFSLLVILLAIIIILAITKASQKQRLQKDFLEGSEKDVSDSIIEAADNPCSSKEWRLIPKNREMTMLLGNENIAATKIIFTTQESSKNVSLKIQKPSKTPESSKELFKETYQILGISKKNLKDSELANAVIRFRIEKGWFANKEACPREMILARYKNGWKNIETDYKGSDGEYHYYESAVSGFSYFAITAKDDIYDQKPKEKKAEAVVAAKEAVIAKKEAEEPKEKPEKEIKEKPEIQKPSSKTLIIVLLAIIAVLVLAVIFTTPYISDYLASRQNITNITPAVAITAVNITDTTANATDAATDAATVDNVSDTAPANVSDEAADTGEIKESILSRALQKTKNALARAKASLISVFSREEAEAPAEIPEIPEPVQNDTEPTQPDTTEPTQPDEVQPEVQPDITEQADEIEMQILELIDYVESQNLSDSFTYQIWSMNTNRVIDLAEYVYDEDGDPLAYSVSEIGKNITAKIQDTNLILTPDQGWYGIRTATITADDGRGGVLDIEINLIVTKAPLEEEQEPFKISMPGLSKAGKSVKSFFIAYYPYVLFGVIAAAIVIFILEMQKRNGKTSKKSARPKKAKKGKNKKR